MIADGTAAGITVELALKQCSEFPYVYLDTLVAFVHGELSVNL
jgi:hypothetical protein